MLTEMLVFCYLRNVKMIHNTFVKTKQNFKNIEEAKYTKIWYNYIDWR